MSCLNLFTNKIEQGHQGRVGRYGDPLAHDTLRVNDFTGQHGATVHRELQDMNHRFAAVHFHVRACRHKVSTALSFLGSLVIEQAPKRPNIARLFDVGRVNVNRARIVSEHFLPLSVGHIGCEEQSQTAHQSSHEFQSRSKTSGGCWVFHFLSLVFHGPYYKVVV